MLMKDVARYFDNEQVFDGYTDDPLFAAQLGNFDDSTSVGATLRRRTISLSPELEMPTRQCVRVNTLRWLSGLGIIESFQGVDIRNTYNLRLATDYFMLSTPGELVATTPAGVMAYAYSEFFKSTTDSKVDSEFDSFWNIFFAVGEPVAAGTILTSDTRALRVRQSYVSPDLLVICQTDELDKDWSQNVTISALGAYNPITDTEDSVITSCKAIFLDLNKLYSWRNQAESGAVGDKVLLVPYTVPVRVGAIVTIGSSKWRVISYRTELDSWELQIRPV